MIPLIESKRPELTALCVRHHVQRLELFGSAVNGEAFDPEKSDLDFLVEFQELPLGQRAEAYFGLLAGMEDLFGRAVDLVMTRAIQNRYFLEEVEATRTVLYAA